MPSRILRDSIVTSESVASLPPDVQDRLHRYFLHADDFGCFRLQPAVIKGAIFPLRPDMTEARIEADLDAYASVDIVRTWVADDGKTYCGFPNWNHHQRPAKPGTRHKTPVPPWESGSIPALPGSSGKGPEASGDNGEIPVSRAGAQSQSQSQSQSQATEPPAASASASLPLLPEKLPETKSGKQRKREATPEQAACRGAIRSRFLAEYTARSGGAEFRWSTAENMALISLAALDGAGGVNPAKGLRALETFIERMSVKRYYAENFAPRIVVQELNNLRLPVVADGAPRAPGRASSKDATAVELRKQSQDAEEAQRLRENGFKPPSIQLTAKGAP